MTEQRQISKIALGSAQLGMDYGINNKTGKPQKDEIEDIIKTAYENKIDTIDTAYNYGDSENNLGEIRAEIKDRFKFISKAPKGINKSNFEDIFNESLKRLKIERFYGYMFHDFKDFRKDEKIIELFKKEREEGRVLKTGFSLYDTGDLEYLFEKDIEFEIIQIPYSIADRRFEKYFEKIKERNIELHTRSVFLQGLFFKRPEELDGKLKSIEEFIVNLNNITNELNRNIQNIALNFVLQNKLVDKAVIGAERAMQLEENIEEEKRPLKEEEIEMIEERLRNIEIEEELLKPNNWK